MMTVITTSPPMTTGTRTSRSNCEAPEETTKIKIRIDRVYRIGRIMLQIYSKLIA